MKYYHVDVFSTKPFSGNGLTVVFADMPLDADDMLKITRELRQFETIFIFDKSADGVYPARIFTLDEELNFAGHPILGAGAVLHRIHYFSEKKTDIMLDLSGRVVSVSSEIAGDCYSVTMNQGAPAFIHDIDRCGYGEIADALGLQMGDIHETLPVEVVSTGLPYLLVPLKQGIDRAKISISGFQAFLERFGAKFVYVFEPNSLECRTWDNNGIMEDVATGSAAGPLCAYLVKHGMAKPDEVISIRQGRFLHRPSVIKACMTHVSGEVFISGDVSFFAAGEIQL
jgi:PhzF family phenazine biosynthesis protein